MKRRAHESGQVLVIVAAGLIGLIAMVGLVIDGGYAWGRQRMTQNGADSIAKAGATVILEWLGGDSSRQLGDISCAVNRAAQEHEVDIEDAQLTDHLGEPIDVPVPPTCDPGAGGDIPLEAQGVAAVTTQEFDTFLMPVVGIDRLTARADATAIVGPRILSGAVLPVTFPQTLEICDTQEVTYTVRDWNKSDDGLTADVDNTWEPYEILPDPNDPDFGQYGTPDENNLAIIPLCTTGPGSVGWLDFGCAPNLERTISEQCPVQFSIPDWIQTQTGNVNNLEDELAAYHGSEPGEYEPEGSGPNHDHRVTLPIHVDTCEEDAGVSDTNGDGRVDDLNDCPDGVWTGGEGNNLYYGVPFWVGFVLDEAYVQGGDPECQDPDAPGKPLLDNPGGGVGCLKGWFVERFAAPGEVGVGDVTPGGNDEIGIALIN